jgi:hypothetical protein
VLSHAGLRPSLASMAFHASQCVADCSRGGMKIATRYKISTALANSFYPSGGAFYPSGGAFVAKLRISQQLDLFIEPQDDVTRRALGR